MPDKPVTKSSSSFSNKRAIGIGCLTFFILLCIMSIVENISESRLQSALGKYLMIHGLHHLDANCGDNPNFVLPTVEEIGVNDSIIVLLQKPDSEMDKTILGEHLYMQWDVYRRWKIDNQKGRPPEYCDSGYDVQRYKPVYLAFESRQADTLNSQEDYDIEKIVADSVLKSDPRFIKMSSEKKVLWVIIKASDSLCGPYTQVEGDSILSKSKVSLIAAGHYE